MEYGDAIQELQDRERQLVRKDALILKLKERDQRRREERRQLQAELARAKNNIGELNSMIVRLERSLESVRRAHEKQAQTIVNQGNTIHALNLENASLQGLNADLVGESRELRRKRELAEGAVDVQKAMLRRMLKEARERIKVLQDKLEAAEEDECDCAPDLALAACEKKLEQLEGMLEAQRRTNRDLGVYLQRARDQRTAAQVDLEQVTRELTKDRDMWKQRAEIAEPTSRIHENTSTEYYQKIQKLEKELKDERDRTLRALTLMRRGANILDPVKGVTGVESTFTPPVPEWEAAILRTPAKKATPREGLHRCGGLNGSHSCTRLYGPGGSPPHPPRHRCHCGFTWPW